MAEYPHLTVRQSGYATVVKTVPAFAWRCDECGWLGTGHLSEDTAADEGADHLWKEHHLASCEHGVHSRLHDFHYVPRSDSLEKCFRCDWVIGK